MLERVRIVNDLDGLAAVIGRAGESPEVVLEATYGGGKSTWGTDISAVYTVG